MPLVTLAIVPNTPLLLPGLAREARQHMARTAAAVAQVGSNLHAREPDVLLVVGSLGQSKWRQPRLLQSPLWQTNFTEVGDITTQFTRRGAVGFTHRLREKWETLYPLFLTTPRALPLEFSVPLVALGASVAEVPVVYFHVPAGLPPGEVKQLAWVMSEALAAAPERVGLVAVGTLARHLPNQAGHAKVFDQAFVSAVAEQSLESLLNLEPELRRQVEDTLWAPVVLMLDSLGERSVKLTPLFYDVPAGVGLLTGSGELG